MVKKLLSGIIVLISVFVLLITGLYLSRPFFHFTQPVKSDLLIIEAWISPFEIEQALQMINSDSITGVIIVGKNFQDDSDSIVSMINKDSESPIPSEEKSGGGIWLLTNSSLAFNMMTVPVACELDDSINVKIRAKGSECAGYFAHFNLIVNGTYQTGAFTSAKDSVFSFVIKQPTDGLQSVIIHFDNDLVHQNQDRNLNIISIKVGDTEMEANDQNSLLVKNDGRYANGFNSQADERMNYLIQSGVSPKKIKTISFEPVKRNQTLAAAKAIRNSSIVTETSSINIISSDIHSRRTWFTYKKVFGDDIQLGLINFEQSDYKKGITEDGFSEFLQLADEALSYLFNWLYLSFGGR